MITDTLKNLIVDYIVTQVVGGDLGLGGNSTSPNATTLDVPLSLSASNYTISAVATNENILEIKMVIPFSNISGKTIREMGVFDDASFTNMLTRINFDGVGPFSATGDLEILIIMEVE